MNQEELLEELQSGEVTITDLRRLQSDIRAHTELYVPHRPALAEDWWNRKKSVVSRRLMPDDGSTDTTTEEETQSDTK